MNYAGFQETRYFGSLDGLRAISMFLVLIAHSHVTALYPINGHTGVTVFFVISGFLITTLLVREERRDGKVALSGFYIRRVFRLLPLYYLALAVFSVAVFAGLADNAGDYQSRLVFFLTFTNEFASSGTFSHSWSLAIEEKFYLVWALAFLAPAIARFRIGVSIALIVVTTAIGLLLPGAYLGIYFPIVAGCGLALAADSPAAYALISRLSTAAVGLPLVLASVALMFLAPNGHVQVPVGIALTLTFPFLVFGPARRLLAARPLVFVGKRAYAIYLFHPLVGSAVDVVFDAGSSVAAQLAHLLFMFVGSLIVADLLFRFFEGPLIRLGHRLAGRTKALKGVPLVNAESTPPSR